MKQIFIGKGKSELISTGGNSLCGLLYRREMQAALAENFTSKRSDAISDRDILSTQIGLLWEKGKRVRGKGSGCAMKH